MHRRYLNVSAAETSATWPSWAGALLEGLRRELDSLEVEWQDRAFLATTKGMAYRPAAPENHPGIAASA